MFADHFAGAVEREVSFDAVAVSGARVLCGERPAPHVRSLAADVLNVSVVHAEALPDGYAVEYDGDTYEMWIRIFRE